VELEQLTKELSADDPYVRCNAIGHLATLGTAEATSLIRTALSDENTKVRYAALTRLAALPEHVSAEDIVSLLDDENETIRVQCAAALGRLGTPDVLERLFERLERCGPEQSKMRATLVQSIGNHCGLDSVERLKAHLKDPDDRVRANACEAIDSTYRRNVAPLLEPLLEDENNRVRGNAIVAMWRFDKKLCLDVLSTMMLSDNKWFRLSAIWAAGEIGVPDALAGVLPLLQDSDSDVRIFAIKTVAANCRFNLRKHLEQAVSDTDATVAYYAKKALEEMDDA